MLILAGGALALVVPTSATAAAVPYHDTYAQGYVGLCDAHGNNITHGSVYDKPFVWRAVSSAPAPKAYGGSGRKASLYAYQPRQGVDPSGWSGDALTAASTYTNVALPIAQATKRDFALSDYLNDYPPLWNGLIELRIFYSAPNMSVETSTYAATDIQVSGTQWRLVRGGHVNCLAGNATSPEAALPASNKSGLQPAQHLSAAAKKIIAASVPLTVNANGAITPAPAANSGANNPANAASVSHSDGGIGSMPLIAGIAAALALGGGGLWYLRRARMQPEPVVQTTSSHRRHAPTGGDR